MAEKKPLIEHVRRAVQLAKELDTAEDDDREGGQESRRTLPSDPFEKMIEKINENYVTVGLIGITSTGKSSVINAFMGRRLLVERAKPSSNIVVHCRKSPDDSLRVEICFGDGKDSEIHCLGEPGFGKDEDLARLIRSYSDESENENNRAQVEVIRIWTPEFKLGAGVMVADTPGLNAYSYDKHEELTWSFLAPMVDIAILVCTVKSSSDSDNMNYLRRLRNYEKKTVVMQNMKDSVIAEIGRGGAVRKTSGENLKILYDRLSEVVGNAYGNHEPPLIFQVSAKEASDPETYGRSGFPELIEALKDKLEHCKDELELMRSKVIIREIRTLTEKAGEKKSDDKLTETILAVAEIEDIKKTIANEYNDFRDKYIKLTEYIIKKREHYKDLKIFGKMSETEAEKLVEGFQAFINGSVSGLIGLVTGTSSKASGFAKSLDMEEFDLRSSFLRKKTGKTAISIPKEEIDDWVWQDQDGLLSGAKRFFGSLFGKRSWGREKRHFKRFEVNVEKLREKISLCLEGFLREISAMLRESSANVNMWYTRLAEEVQDKLSRARRQDELRRKVAANRELLGKFQDLLQELKSDYMDMGTPRPGPQDEPTRPGEGHMASPSESLERVAADPVALSLATLGMTVRATARIAARDHFLSESKIGAEGKAVVLGQENDAIDAFLNEYWFDYAPSGRDGGAMTESDGGKAPVVQGPVRKTESDVLRYTGPDGCPELMVLRPETLYNAEERDDSDGDSDNEAERKLELDGLTVDNACIFFLINALQPGESANQLFTKSLETLEILKKSKYLTLVLQNAHIYSYRNIVIKDIKEFIETLSYYKHDIFQKTKIQVNSFLANCNDPGLTVLGDLYFKYDNILSKLNDMDIVNYFDKISDSKIYTYFISEITKITR
ncbi:MAG: dynamin family protein [Deltaproteobacteria bacterium]|jgi:GTPase Era involved in 16S rRNA processing|nr:dynamin family protein [Deltaproteobacteria bacterium]